jgi:hypothetical protein
MHESGVRLPDIEARFVRQACGKRSADNEVGLQLEPAAGGLDALPVGLISGPVAGRGFEMPFLASSLDELIRSGLLCE